MSALSPPPLPSGAPACFVGRRGEIEILTGHLRAGERVVSIIGPGGIGKTRLAAEVSADLQPACFCDLTEARDGDGIVSAAARAVAAAGATAEEVAARLVELGPAFVIVDNCEQVVEAVVRLLDAWLELAPETQFLITSRERLRQADEIVFELGPLAPADAVTLFLYRARRIAPWYGDGDPQAVDAIVRRLDGMPLALELAAARAAVLSPPELLARLVERFDSLGAGRRGAGRHATLRAALDWSWNLLSSKEQAALAQLSVFRGGFHLDAAEAVLDLGAGAISILDLIQSLRDKSLITSEPDTGGALRFGMYATIREYAHEWLAAAGGTDRAAGRHAGYFGLRADSLGEDVAAIGAEEDNLIAVVERALVVPAGADLLAGVRALCALAPLRLARGPLASYAVQLDKLMEAPGFGGVDIGLRARAHLARGRARELAGSEGAAADYEQALALAGEAADRRLQLRLLLRLGGVEVAAGDTERAGEHYELARLLAQKLGDRLLEARALANLGVAASEGERVDDARHHLESARDIYIELGDRRREAMARGNLANVLADEGEPEIARGMLHEVCAELVGAGDRRTAALFTAAAATIDHVRGDLAAARRGYGAALQAVHEIGDRAAEGVVLGYLGALAADEGELYAASEHFRSAAELLSNFGDASALAAQVIHRVHLDVARGDHDAGRRAIEVPQPRSHKVRLALRLLRAALGREGARRRAPEILEIGPGASWFRPPGGAEVSLGRRRTLRRILMALADAHGRELDADALFAAGWPGEQVAPDSAANRLRVAVATLRKLGLRPYLLTGPDGYALDPGIEIKRLGG